MTPANEPAIQAWCIAYLARVTRQPAARIDPDSTFQALGLDSAEMLFLVSAIEDEFAIELSSDAPADHPTPAALSRFVASRA